MKKEDYKGYIGFHDFRRFKLNKREFSGLWEIQDNLFMMSEDPEYFKKWHPAQWQKGQEISGKVTLLLMKRGDL